MRIFLKADAAVISTRSLALATVLLGALCGAVAAQPVPSREPTSTHIFPAGGRRGSTVSVRVGAECLPPGAGLRMTGAGVSAAAELGSRLADIRSMPSPRRKPTEIPICYPKEWQSQVSIAADAPVGVALWRLTSARGGSSARPFIVGDLPEFIETEPNSTAAAAERVTLPVTLNGQVAGEWDSDHFAFDVAAGATVVADVAAARLGSPLDPVVELWGPAGTRLRPFEWRVGSDPVLAFDATVAGTYRLSLRNVKLQGDPSLVYRLTLSTRPYVAFAFPAGGKGGAEFPATLTALTGAGPTRSFVEPLRLDAGARGTVWHRAASFDNAVPIQVGSVADVAEAAGNDAQASAMPLALPHSVSARFESKDDQDWFRFDAKKGDRIELAAQPWPAGGSAIPVLELRDASGVVKGKASGADAPDHQCRLAWQAPDAGTYFIVLSDLRRGARGGPEFIYRLHASANAPNFELAISADHLHVVQGAKAEYDLQVRRSGGLDGAIDLALVDAPAGVKLEPAQVPAGQASIKVAVVADAAALSRYTSVRLAGRADVAGEKIERMATASHLGRDAEGASIDRAVTEELGLTVQHKPVFRLFTAEAYQYAYRGSVYPARMEVERLNGFTGPIVLQVGDRQNRDLDGIEMFEVEIPPDAKEVRLPVFFPETMHINVQSQSQLYVQAYAKFQDAQGAPQSVLVVSEKRLIFRTLPPPAKLRVESAPSEVTAGGEAVVRLSLDRTSLFTGAADVALQSTAGGEAWTAPKVVLAHGQSAAEMRVRVPEGVKPGTVVRLRFRATGVIVDDKTLLSEAEAVVTVR